MAGGGFGMSSLQSGRWWCMVQLNAMVACDVALVSVAKVVEARGLCGGMVCCDGRRGVGRHVVCMGDDMERVRGVMCGGRGPWHA